MKNNSKILKISIRVALAYLLGAGLVDHAAAQSVSFIAGRHFPALFGGSSGRPSPIVQGDFNRDGVSDLVINQGGVLLGHGDGTFQGVRGFDPLIAHRSIDFIASGDFNRDGIPDLAATTNVGAWILIGNGDGKFQTPAPVFSLPEEQSDISLAVGDFNRDGVEDLAIPHQSRKLTSPPGYGHIAWQWQRNLSAGARTHSRPSGGANFRCHRRLQPGWIAGSGMV